MSEFHVAASRLSECAYQEIDLACAGGFALCGLIVGVGLGVVVMRLGPILGIETELDLEPAVDAFVREFNYERPHEALEMKCPADVYKPSGPIAASVSFLTPFTIAPLWLLTAGEFAFSERKLISVLLWRVKPSASRRLTMASGW